MTGRLAGVRQAYAHDAVVVLDPGGDARAPGGAVTVALCGHWEHEPPCRLAAHHTAASTSGDALALRVLFAAAPNDEPRVRAAIERALASGRLTGADGRTTTWTLRGSTPGTLRAAEADHAARLVAS